MLLPDHCLCIERQHLRPSQNQGKCQHIQSHAVQFRCTAISLATFFLTCDYPSPATPFNNSSGTITKRAQHTHLAYLAPQSEHALVECSQPAFGSRFLSASANFFKYQVFQDLQGPASSLRVGSSVRTSTRPLSVSLLRLCLRYLTCIQRR
jgi:hypothetical protein